MSIAAKPIRIAVCGTCDNIYNLNDVLDGELLPCGHRFRLLLSGAASICQAVDARDELERLRKNELICDEYEERDAS